MGASQERQEEQGCLKGHEASVLGWLLGQGRPMNREALELMPPLRVSSVVSPSTYFGASQRGYAGAAASVGIAVNFIPFTIFPPTQNKTW